MADNRTIILKIDKRGARKASHLNYIERWAKITAIVLIPVMLGLGGYYFSNLASERSVEVEYVRLAVAILQADNSSPGLNDWAVRVLDAHSDVKLGDTEEPGSSLRAGKTRLPSPARVISTSYGMAVDRATWMLFYALGEVVSPAPGPNPTYLSELASLKPTLGKEGRLSAAQALASRLLSTFNDPRQYARTSAISPDEMQTQVAALIVRPSATMEDLVRLVEQWFRLIN